MPRSQVRITGWRGFTLPNTLMPQLPTWHLLRAVPLESYKFYCVGQGTLKGSPGGLAGSSNAALLRDTGTVQFEEPSDRRERAAPMCRRTVNRSV